MRSLWYYYNKMHDSRKRLLPKAFDQILYYVKSKEANYTFNALTEERDRTCPPTEASEGRGEDGRRPRRRRARRCTRKRPTGRVDTVWRIRALQPANKAEWVHYDTQKPGDLIERILTLASQPGDLVADFFVGSGHDSGGRREAGSPMDRVRPWSVRDPHRRASA